MFIFYRSAVLISLLIVVPLLSSASNPSAYVDAINTCVKPSGFVKVGQLSGHGATATVACNGGSGAGSSVELTVNFGPQIGGTVDIGEVTGGNLMSAFFAGGYAYITSALHGSMFTDSGIETHDPSACNQCYTLMLVQRVSTREHYDSPGPLLIDRGIAIIKLLPTSDYRREAETAYFKATAFFDGRELTSRSFLHVSNVQH